MKTRIEGRPAFAYLQLTLEPGESVVAESDAMASMSAELDLRTRLNGGFWRGLARKYLGGESLFINRFSNATQQPRTLTLVQPTPGDILCRELAPGEAYCLQPGAFLAADESVTLGLKWAGWVSWIAREGMFKMVVTGPGRVWYGSYGALLERMLDGETIVDTSHLVAYEPGVQLRLQLAGGIFSSFFGGEGLVTRLTGKGKYVIQTRSLTGLSGWLNPKLWG
ncbi:TIGR00266 family protein [Solimonas sp. K1W22B-7]|uniref:TIGR00266 family protein n=1 Tax=Solimonas sp. K1W22B-7 TaxID=2303331 RepID=UPI000E33023A|nr:TIGR00266 family protein [Solimonas sp. K1W22B-7]AXQ29817.1 TIGR00266 family protein [Solimonas sp. K1W22B-7]